MHYRVFTFLLLAFQKTFDGLKWSALVIYLPTFRNNHESRLINALINLP